ncbi:MAG: hypothetical protein U0324_46030 [Polyangiales bacterium]
MAEKTLTAWHYLLHVLLEEKGSRRFEYRCEEPLTKTRQSMDWLLVRKRKDAPAEADDAPETLRRLWGLLPDTSIVEFKSTSRGYRPRELHRLLGYGEQYFSANAGTVATPADLALVLLVGVRNETLDADLAARKLRRTVLGHGGYWRLHGAHYPTYLVDITEVTRHDVDDPIVVFTKNPTLPRKACNWWYAHVAMDKIVDISTLDGFEEMQREFLSRLPVEERLAGLKPEDRLAGLKPEDRLRDLTPAQAVLALPLELLRALPESYLATLPDDVQRTVRERLSR